MRIGKVITRSFRLFNHDKPRKSGLLQANELRLILSYVTFSYPLIVPVLLAALRPLIVPHKSGSVLSSPQRRCEQIIGIFILTLPCTEHGQTVTMSKRFLNPLIEASMSLLVDSICSKTSGTYTMDRYRSRINVIPCCGPYCKLTATELPDTAGCRQCTSCLYRRPTRRLCCPGQSRAYPR